MSISQVLIRNAERKDCPEVICLKKELAVHSNMADKPMLSYQELERDGFDTNPPFFHCIVAEINCTEPQIVKATEMDIKNVKNDEKLQLVGYALYFYAYAAWEGKVLFLEDLCISKNVRGKGIGTLFLKELAKIAVKEKCSRIQLEVLNWNETALNFYNKHNGTDLTATEGWHNFRFDKEAIRKLATS